MEKLPLELIPASMYRALGRSLGYGVGKYGRDNFRQGDGLPWSLVYGALLRHLTAWWEGEDMDEESGNGHLDHAAAMLAFLIEYMERRDRYGNKDDRWRPD